MPADTCGARSGPLVCDRAPHVDGDHRGYDEARDAVMFWPTTEKRIAGLGDAIAAALEDLDPQVRALAVIRLSVLLELARGASSSPAPDPLAVALYVLIRDGDITRERAADVVRDHVQRSAGAAPVFSDVDLAAWIATLLEAGRS